ncbi:hypothetical protein BDU57DRAFT_234685 [Ampelomyces quisqualis]|uniref:Uncharacterized protein n=1 Tax=Ampelomyces quisqualis TaxID=50730 RepID=A0A6A5QPR2_AMPQU|nr:hypothetical protein BDU57DRAFT_234685 [Ampelomyces quisqualis]
MSVLLMILRLSETSLHVADHPAIRVLAFFSPSFTTWILATTSKEGRPRGCSFTSKVAWRAIIRALHCIICEHDMTLMLSGYSQARFPQVGVLCKINSVPGATSLRCSPSHEPWPTCFSHCENCHRKSFPCYLTLFQHVR